MKAIYKRELKAYFCSFIGLLFMGVTLFFLGLYFTVYNLMYGYPYFSYAVNGSLFVLLLAVPILTMRSLAEEKHAKTDQLILTAPVSVGQIVLGKYLALLTIFAIPVAISCVYPLIMSRFGIVPMLESYLSIAGFLLFGMTALAVGLFVSALTESQVIAAVLGFLILFLGYMMTSITGLLSVTGNWLTKILNCFDLYTPFTKLLSGTMDITSIVYYLTLTVLLLFLTTQAIQKRRYSVSVKNFRFGAYSVGTIAVMVAIVVVANLVLRELPTDMTVVDLTTDKLYSITDTTRDYVQNLTEDVTIYVLANEDNQDSTLEQTLKKYEDLSDHISVVYMDPTINPMFARQYTSENLSANSLIVVSDKRNKVIDYSAIYESNFDYNTYTTTTTGYDGEGQITSAIDYVLTDDMPKAYMTTGHGEFTFETEFTTALKRENVEYETVNLMDQDSVPVDAACLIIPGPTSDFSKDDTEKVLDYMNGGGKVILVTSYAMEEHPNLDSIMEYMGLSLVDGLVVEKNSDHYYGAPYYLLPEVEVSAYTKGIYGNYYIFAPVSQGIRVPGEEETGEDMSYTTFLSTSDKAFAKADAGNMEEFEKEEGDIDGPFAIGVEAVKSLGDQSATLIAVGCDQLFTADADSMVGGANRMLFVNMVSSFVNHESSISVPVKSYSVSNIAVPQAKMILVGAITTVILPLAAVAIGFIIWLRRRRR